MIIKEPVTCDDDSESSTTTSTVLQYVIFTVFILLAIVSVVVCAVLYDTRTPDNIIIDKPSTPVSETNVVSHKIRCIDVSSDGFCREYIVYKVIKD